MLIHWPLDIFMANLISNYYQVGKRKYVSEDQIENALQYHSIDLLLATYENLEIENFWFIICVLKIDSKIIK